LVKILSLALLCSLDMGVKTNLSYKLILCNFLNQDCENTHNTKLCYIIIDLIV